MNASPGLSSTSTAPSGSMIGSPGFSGRPARVLFLWLPGMTLVLP